MAEVILLNGEIALVDDEDMSLVSSYQWAAARHHTNHPVYAIAYVAKNSPVSMHRLILRALPGQIIDHMNGNGLDNRRENLRFCTHTQNMRNRRVSALDTKTSRFKGVYWESHLGHWRAQIVCNGAKIRKVFADEVDAAKWYDSMAQEFFGEFARLNFPMEATVV